MNFTEFKYLLFTWTSVGLIVFIILLFIPAPYGRHTKRNWGPMIPNNVGWVLMELPSLVLFSSFFLFGPGEPQNLAWIFFALYAAHYINRSLIFPFRIRTRGKQMPLVIALFAVCFNVVNGSVNGLYFNMFSREYTIEWLYDARFIIGIVLFFAGVLINLRSDRILLRLRNGQKGYQIPYGGLYKYVSCPNFFGEIIEWTGFAVMTWSPAALTFLLWTIFNLVPRALDHHKWYRNTFEDYPSDRKAVVPYLL